MLGSLTKQICLIKQKLEGNLSFLEKSLEISQDLPLEPLQPLSNNLTSSIYQTFEFDEVKYEYYQKAIEASIQAKFSLLKKVVLIGAGRGPLLKLIIQALKKISGQATITGFGQSKIEVYVLEKNRNCLPF